MCVSVCVNALARCVALCFIIPASDKDYSVFWVDYKAIGVSCVKYDYVGIE